MTSSDSEHPSNATLLREALELLDSLKFDGVRGGVVRSDSVFISVVPEWEQGDDGTFSANLTCQATWHHSVDWSPLRVSARPERPTGFFVQHMLPVSDRGQATFIELEPGNYVLRGYSRLAQFTAPSVQRDDNDDVTELATGVAMDGSATSTADGEILTKTGPDSDDVAVLIRRKGQRVAIEFATASADVASKTIEFFVTDPNSNEVYLDAQEAVFGDANAEAEFTYMTKPTELSFASAVDVEVSYRLR